MRRFLILLLAALTITACNNKNSFKIEGNIKQKQKDKIYLSRLDVDTPLLIDSASIKKNGQFSFRIESTEPNFYQLGYSKNDYITVLAGPREDIKLTFPQKNLSAEYSVKGSIGSAQIQMLDNSLAETKRKLDSLKVEYDRASKLPGFDATGPVLEKEYSDLIKEQRMKNIEFIVNNVNSMASIKALYQKINEDTYVLYEPRDLQYLKIVSDSLNYHYPNSKHAQALARDLKKELNQMYASQIQQITNSVPETDLNPNLKDINGNRVALSSLRGKYVLLTFWSVTSKESIAENIQLKEYYKSYRNKGFEIYQINLDQNEDQWKSAVKFDELPWISTREDDPLNPATARLFNVRSLPTNYLFNPKGEIIATDIHGRTLQIKLAQLFNK